MESRDEKYTRARERVAAIKKFYGKLFRSFILIAFLAGLNYYTNGFEYMWFLWVALFVGIGVVSEALKTFGTGWILGRNWEERKIKEMMDKEEPGTRSSNRWE